jgi:hypothetical protein
MSEENSQAYFCLYTYRYIIYKHYIMYHHIFESMHECTYTCAVVRTILYTCILVIIHICTYLRSVIVLACIYKYI